MSDFRPVNLEKIGRPFQGRSFPAKASWCRSAMRGIDLETNEDAFVWSPEDKEAGEPSAIEFSQDGKYALCGSSTGEITLRDSHTGAVLLRQAAFDGAIGAVGISRDSTQIAAANAERTLRVWKLGTIAQPETMATKSIEVTDVSAPDVLEMESGPSGESKLSANLNVEFIKDGKCACVRDQVARSLPLRFGWLRRAKD